MKRLSSEWSSVIQVAHPVLSVAFLVAGLMMLPMHGVFLCLLSLGNLIYWWRVLRKLTEVSMDERGLFIATEANEKDLFIPFLRISVVRRIPYARRGPVLLVFRNEAGALVEFIFLPVREATLRLEDDVVYLLRSKAGLPVTDLE